MPQKIPKVICVDLDGTLIAEDVGKIAICTWSRMPLKKRMSFIPYLIQGKLFFKYKLSQVININPNNLKYNDKLVNWLAQKKKEGHTVILASASQKNYVEAIFNHINIFDDYHASDDKVHLIGVNKGKLLAEKYGAHKFLYCGNSWLDLGVWHYASHAVIVNLPFIPRKIIEKTGKVVDVFNL
ncbi:MULTISPECIES: hypothetical protein [Candidatus Ichthyocystis]|uniref:hypothetical protein n=1 Tax=Candidatus Ichthyocystis TaxID=2929841 RepID=UPI000B82A7ED|nr:MULTISPECIES: hypothetical protein [Ichthyocystis]